MTSRRQPETRWVVTKDYYRSPSGYGDNDLFSEEFPVLYGTKEEADAKMAQIATGYDKSFFDPVGNGYAGYEATLRVDRISI